MHSDQMEGLNKAMSRNQYHQKEQKINKTKAGSLKK